VTILDQDGKAALPAAGATIAIVMPTTDFMPADTAFDLARMTNYTLHARPDLTVRLYHMKSTLIADGRHNLVVEAKRAGCEWILWLDSDMRFPKDTLVRLLAHGEACVVGGYATRRAPCEPTVEIEGKGRVYPTADATGLVPVDWAGMGCMLTHVETCFPNGALPWFAIGFSPKHGVYTGEDVYFCRQLKKLGVPVHLDLALTNELGHVGTFEFRMDHARAMREVRAAVDAEATPEEATSGAH